MDWIEKNEKILGTIILGCPAITFRNIVLGKKLISSGISVKIFLKNHEYQLNNQLSQKQKTAP